MNSHTLLEPSLILKRAALLVRRPRSRDELYLVIKKGLGVHLSRKASTEGHSCLLDIAWEIVSRQHLNFLIVGPRGGGKTRLVSTIEFLEGCWGTPEIFHVGAITEQAKRGYDYILEYATLPHTKFFLDGEPLLSSTGWVDGRSLEESDYIVLDWGKPEIHRPLTSVMGRKAPKLSIHPGTVHQVSGGHPHFKTFDELERAKPRVVQQFTGMGREGTVSVYLSTRETAHGLVQRKMDEARETGTPRLHFLDLWDTKARCPECLKGECLLWDDCQGRYKDTDGHRSRAALEQRKAETDEETWRVQFRMEEPGTQSLVWANFTDANLSEAAVYKPDQPFEVWCDDNVAAPRAIIFAQVAGDEIRLFDSYYEPHKTQDKSVADVLARGYGKPKIAVVMAGDASLKQAWHDAQVQTYSVKSPYTRKEGANAVRRLICDATGHRALVIHPRTGQNATLIKHVRRHYRNEVEPSVFSEEPAKHPEDHFPDTVSYGCWYHRRMGS